MVRPSVQEALESILHCLPNKFGRTCFGLLDYKNQTGAIKLVVQGYYDRPYTFDVSLKEIRGVFKWLEGILISPLAVDHDFQFFDKKKERNLAMGYLPAVGYGSYRESDVSSDFPEIPLNECGIFYVYDIEKDTVLESAFVHFEDLVRMIYTSIKRCKRLRSSSKMIVSYFLDKKKIFYHYKGIVCKGTINKDDLRYYGVFQDENGNRLERWGFADDYESAFKNHARSVINQILEHREYLRKNSAWKASLDIESIGCVFDILPKAFKKRILEGKYDFSLNQKVPGGDYEVPLPYVTKAWDYLLKGTLCANEFRVERDFEFDDSAQRSKEEALEQNEQMKEIWKEHFKIDIDSLEIDFSSFNMHLPPNVDKDEVYKYFQDVPDGVEEWILCGINSPSGKCSFDSVSCLMEFAAYIGIERETWDE